MVTFQPLEPQALRPRDAMVGVQTRVDEISKDPRFDWHRLNSATAVTPDRITMITSMMVSDSFDIASLTTRGARGIDAWVVVGLRVLSFDSAVAAVVVGAAGIVVGEADVVVDTAAAAVFEMLPAVVGVVVAPAVDVKKTPPIVVAAVKVTSGFWAVCAARVVEVEAASAKIQSPLHSSSQVASSWQNRLFSGPV